MHIAKGSETPAVGATPSTRQWAETPGHATPAGGMSTRRNRWDETPRVDSLNAAGAMTPGWGSGAETPRIIQPHGDVPEVKPSETPGTAAKRRSRWDLTPAQTPAGAATSGSFTPTVGGASAGQFTPKMSTPVQMTPSGITPVGSAAMGMQTPGLMTPEQLQVCAGIQISMLKDYKAIASIRLSFC